MFLGDIMFQSYNTKEFGNYLKKLRKTLRLTQSDVEKMSGISIDAIRRLENGTVIPRYDTLVFLSLTYKKDLVREFNSFSNANEIMEFYHKIDKLIANSNEEKLHQLKSDYRNYIESSESIELVNNTLKKQISLIIDGILLLFMEKKTDEAMSLFMEAIELSIINFEVKQFNKFKYTLIELRILMLIGLSLLIQRSSDLSNKILSYCLTTLNTSLIASNDEKMLIAKLMFNISYNFHIMDRYEDSLQMANQGIDYCNQHFISFGLPGLLFRKGMAMFNLKLEDYNKFFDQALSLLEIQGNLRMHQIFKDAIDNRYNS